MNNILICGNRSFVARGLYEQLIGIGFQVDCFTRGEEKRDGDQITGDVFKVASSVHLAEKYDILINFIVLKDRSIKENLLYIKELTDLCFKKSIKRLIQVSSIMVYNNNELTVNENTPIEINTDKLGYGAIKIEVDHYLMSLKDLPFNISFVRPGYVIAEDRKVPFLKKLPLGFALIKGDRKSIMPIVKREAIHNAIANMLRQETFENVYLFVPSLNKTKYEYANEIGKFIFVFLPKWLILGTARLLKLLGLISKSFYGRIEGMYIEIKYNSSKTEQILQVKF